MLLLSAPRRPVKDAGLAGERPAGQVVQSIQHARAGGRAGHPPGADAQGQAFEAGPLPDTFNSDRLSAACGAPGEAAQVHGWQAVLWG